MSWDSTFPAPISLPGHKALVTLRDAATYITTLPKATQHEQAWQNAVHVLLQAGGLARSAWYRRSIQGRRRPITL